jgi:hypothetical protein
MNTCAELSLKAGYTASAMFPCLLWKEAKQRRAANYRPQAGSCLSSLPGLILVFRPSS